MLAYGLTGLCFTGTRPVIVKKKIKPLFNGFVNLAVLLHARILKFFKKRNTLALAYRYAKTLYFKNNLLIKSDRYLSFIKLRKKFSYVLLKAVALAKNDNRSRKMYTRKNRKLLHVSIYTNLRKKLCTLALVAANVPYLAPLSRASELSALGVNLLRHNWSKNLYSDGMSVFFKNTKLERLVTKHPLLKDKRT
jgi:hypothetical protein